MASQLQLRRGTTAQHAVFTGAAAEVTVDTDKKTVVVHDGATPGGFPITGLAPFISTGSTTARSVQDRSADAVNVKDFGAVADAVKLSNCSMISGSNVLDCSTANFTTSDIGKSIAVGSANATGQTIFTTITGRISATQITIGISASTTVTASDVTYGTEDGPAIRAAVAHARTVNKAVYMPRGQYLMNTALSTASGNPQISSIPVGGGGYGILLQNANGNAPQSFYMFGEGASIVSSLYPPQSGDDVGFTFVQINGLFQELHFEGITFDSYRQLVNSETGPGAVGRVYGFRFGSAVGWDQNNRPFNTRITNCTFYDQTLSIRADSAENLSVTGCNFLYRRGQAGVGNGDWTGAMGVRQVRSLRVVNNYMNGCLADDMDSIVTTFGDHRCVDNFLHTGGGGGEHNQETILVANNVVTRFAREGIFVIASTGSSFDNDITDGVQIVGNWFDGRYPANHRAVTNWAIRTADAHTTIVGNNIFQATVAIFIFASNPVVFGQNAHHTLVEGNNIVLCPASRAGYIGAVGIIFQADNVLVQGNQIVGHDIGSIRQNGWDGTGTAPTATIASSSVANNTITVTGNVWPDGSTVVFSSLPAGSGLTAGAQYFVIDRVGDTFKVSTFPAGSAVDITADVAGATMTAGKLDLTVGMAFLGGANTTYDAQPPTPTCYVKNNSMKIVSKNSPEVLCVALNIDAGNGKCFVSGNIIDGFDFITARQGGNNLSFIFDRNQITRNIRLADGYISASYGAPIIQNHYFRIFPVQAGWYQIPTHAVPNYSSAFNLEISASGLYGDTTTASQVGGQFTRLKFLSYTDEDSSAGSTNSRLVLNQTHAGLFPAVTEAYVRSAFGRFFFYVYVNKVLSKMALTFSGGGAVAPNIATGYANVVNGVVTSVTVTSVGSGYTSAPNVSITSASGISGSGATFTAVLSTDTVGSVTVGGSGGSGYAQPLDFHVVADDRQDGGLGLDYPQYTASTPSNGMKMVFSTGTKTMTLSGGSGGTVTGSGDPVASVVLSATGVAATDLITATGHAFVDGNQIGFQSLTGGAGLTAGTTYFVRDVAGNDFKVAATSGGAAIDFTTDITAATIVPVMPEFIGQQFIDTTNNKIYVATGTAGGKWALLN